MTVAGMIFVNSLGSWGQYPFLRHASWDGCTFADFVFPFFLFIVGASFYLSSRKSGLTLTKARTLTILRRGGFLILIGILLNWCPFTYSWEQLRIPGVLQRIGLVFILSSFIICSLKTPLRILSATIALLLGYWGLLAVTDGWTNESLNTHLIHVIDSTLFGEKHIIQPFEPEALLSTLPAVGNALLGFLAAHLLSSGLNATPSPTSINNPSPSPHTSQAPSPQAPHSRKRAYLACLRLFLVGIIALILALLWQEILPLNKRLWSPSFVLYTCAWGAILWSLLALILDVDRDRHWTAPLQVFGPFQVFGVNALFAYLLSSVIGKCSYLMNFHVSDVPLLLLCWLICLPLYWKRLYIKL